MNIYEKIFARLEELHMSQIELSRRTGIATSTISDWRKKKINPQADKLVAICKALDMSLVDLLCDEEDKKNEVLTADCITDDQIIIESIQLSSVEVKRRILGYLEQWILKEHIKVPNGNVSIIADVDGNKVVVINDLRFKRSKKVDWNTVENYLKEYIGDCAEILDTNEMVYIGSDFPDEYAHSKDTKVLRGPNEYAKANASSAIKELIQIASNKAFTENHKDKHNSKAKYGWYRYDTRFAVPKYDNDGELAGYNIFKGRLVIRHAQDGKLYLYDILRIKKETSEPLE
ncbi:helix-turn-helix domain-containing protein [Lachnospira multipara]|uniref:helix-turn-helix domain-containing protein n=1 Tax=Lachnospira multipara TaxID=28051 RepID=UPI0003FB7ACB|nr:helix-turn-helix transcriptional regulator [Lachnospira multipara]